jgi:hypothetical protein
MHSSAVGLQTKNAAPEIQIARWSSVVATIRLNCSRSAVTMTASRIHRAMRWHVEIHICRPKHTALSYASAAMQFKCSRSAALTPLHAEMTQDPGSNMSAGTHSDGEAACTPRRPPANLNGHAVRPNAGEVASLHLIFPRIW